MSHHKHLLREIGKFATGLITADFFVGLWVYNSQAMPFTFWNINFSAPMLLGWMVFDIILLLVLVHYSWHADIHTPTIKQRTFFMIIGFVLGFVALAHLARIIFGVTLVVGGIEIPFWLSWFGTFAATFISYASFRFAVGKKQR